MINSGILTACYATGSVNGNEYTGGLVGENILGSLTACYATGSVNGNEHTGGLVGKNSSDSPLTACYAKGPTRGMYYVGGLVGVNVPSSDISNCYCSSWVIVGTDYYGVGGFVGCNYGTIVNCYAANKIIKLSTSSYDTFIGAFVGRDNSLASSGSTASYTACFWNTAVSGMTDAVGQSDDDDDETSSPTYPGSDPVGITGLPTATMKVQGLYTSQGWDFIDETTNGIEDFWAIVENVTYPRFASECIDPPVGDVNGDCKLDLLDFAELSEDWLKCGLMDQDLCL